MSVHVKPTLPLNTVEILRERERSEGGEEEMKEKLGTSYIIN